MQAITTKYVGPTDTKGARIKATTSESGDSVTVNYDHARNTDENHLFAANKLKEKLMWRGRMYQGSTKTGYVFVIVDHSLPEIFKD